MPKRSQHTQRGRGRAPRSRPASAALKRSQPSAVIPPSPPQSPKREPAPKYQYVSAELRRIAIIAGAMLLILIVLSFVL